MPFQQRQGQTPEQRQILAAMTPLHAIGVLTERHI
jgi:hypothetical protein